MQSKIASKILTVILSVSLMLQMGIPIVYAEDSDPTEETKPITETVDSGNPKKEETVETRAVKPQEGEAEEGEAIEGGKTPAASLGNNSEENIDEQPQNQQEDADEISPEGEVNRNSLNKFDEETKTEITAFGVLSDTESEITIHMGADEETIKELFAFPETIKATVGETETDLAVTWESDKTFSVEKEDTFILTAKLSDENYTLAEGIKMPTITVRVINNKAVTTLLLENGVTNGGDITSTGVSFAGSIPSEVTRYKAGDGYVLFTPAIKSTSGKNTIELNNAKINSVIKFSILLPSGKVDLIIKGNNELLVDFDEVISCIHGYNTNLFVTGDGTLTAQGGYGVCLEGTSNFIHDDKASYKLNLIAYTNYGDREEQEVFGYAAISSLIPQKANLIIHNDAQLTFKKHYIVGRNWEIYLYNNLSICENAKLIIGDDVCLNIGKNYKDVLPSVYNNGSILVKGILNFCDKSYLKDIAKMNITTQGSGSIIVKGQPIDAASGKFIFDDKNGEILRKDNGGEYICGDGTMKWEPIVDEEENLTSGTITLNNAEITMNSDKNSVPAIIIIPDISVPITLNIIGNNTIENLNDNGILATNLILTGSGTLNGKSRTLISYSIKFDTSNFNGKLNGIVYKLNGNTGTVYGNVSCTDNQETFYYVNLTVENGAMLTIESGALIVDGTLTNNGTIINNGTLSLMRDVDVDELQNWIYGNLNLKGNGIVEVRNPRLSAFALFTNDGKLISKTVITPLNFKDAIEDMGDLAIDGYHWDNQNKKLTIQNLIMYGDSSSDDVCAITLPEGEDVTLELKGYNKITGFKSAVSQGFVKIPELTDKDIPSAKGSLTVYGEGTLMAEKQAYDSKNHENIITTTGKFILKSGNLLLKPEGKTGLASVGMEIKGGCIGQGKIFAPIKSIGSFNMSGGKVISGNGNDEGLVAFGDVTLSGGELITSRAWYSIMTINGNVKISGGKLIAHNSENEPTAGISVFITGDEDKKVSINGGAVDIKTGMSALSFGAYPEAKGKGIFETNGMTVTTNPAGGKLKSTNIILPGPTAEQMTVYALTAEESLKARGPELINACTSLNAVKNQTGGGSSDNEHSSDREHNSGGSLSSSRLSEIQSSISTIQNTISETQAMEILKKQTKRALDLGLKSAHIVIPSMPSLPQSFLIELNRMSRENLGASFNLDFDSMSADRKICARMYVKMDDALRLKKPINTHIFTDSAYQHNLRTERLFEQYFDNNVSVITFGQQDDTGLNIGVALKLDTTEFNKDTIEIYKYDSVKNTFHSVGSQDCYFDRFDYLHFNTTLGNQIVVTDSELIPK